MLHVECSGGKGLADRSHVRRLGGYLVAGWLGGIIVTLVLQADHYDVALRDFGLLLGALTLARLATAFDRTTAGG